MHLTSIEFSFDPCNIYHDCPRAYTGRPKCAKNVLKWWTFKLPAWITGKRSKIDGYIQRGVLQALNSLSNRVTFTAIDPGAYTGEAKMCKKCAKMVNLQTWITGKRLKIDGYIQRGVLQALNPLSNRVTFTAIVPGATPYGGVKCRGVGKSCDFRPISLYSS